MAIRGFEKKDPYAGLNQLMQLMNQMGQMQDRKKRSFLYMHEELGKGLNTIYDKAGLESRKSHFDRYYKENKDSMDEDTLAQFDLLDDKFNIQEKANKDYIKGLEYSKIVGRQVEDSLVAYSDIQEMSKEDLNNMHAKLYPDSKINKTIEQKRTDLREASMLDVQRLVDDYSTFSGEFRTSHGERLGKAGFREDAAYLSNLKEIFAFGIVQAKDDYVFDSAEAEAMQMGIELGSYQPIQDYRTKEASRDRQIQSNQLKDLDDNYKLTAYYQDIIDRANDFHSMTEEEKSKVRDSAWALDANENEITYGMFEDDVTLIDQFDLGRDKAKQNVENIDKSYSKIEGVSWLQTGNVDKNISHLFEEQEPPIPPKPTTPPPPLKDSTKEPKGSAIIADKDKDFFTEDGWYPTEGRQGKGWAAEATVKKDKIDNFMSMAFDPDNFENGKLKEDSEIYQIIQRAKKGGSRRMRKVEDQLKRYAQGIKNLGDLKKEGYEPPSWANKLVDEVQWLLTTKKRFK